MQGNIPSSIRGGKDLAPRKIVGIFLLTILMGIAQVASNASFLDLKYTFNTLAEGPRPMGPTIYHSFDEMEAELNQIAFDHPSITRLESIGTTYEGRNIWAMKISDNPDIEENEPEIYYNGMHHAREWLTMEVCLYIINYLTDNYGANSTVAGIVNSRQIWVVPCVNPDGRVYDSAADDPTSHRNQPAGWRKNRMDNGGGSYGVDLNRNYGHMWGGAGASDTHGSETYRGPSPFSEYETQAVRDFISGHDFVFSISYHSFGQLILYPWGYTYNGTQDEDVFQAVGEKMKALITNKAQSDYPGYTLQQGSDLYMTSGTDDDWLYAEKGILSYTIEIYPHGLDSDANVSSPYDQFHPHQDKIVPVCEDNLEAALYLAQISDNPYQAFDYHVSLSTAVPTQTINQSETNLFPITVLNDGSQNDFYEITTSSIPGWTINVDTPALILSAGEPVEINLSVTVPPATPGGEYRIWVYATSFNNASITNSISVTVYVPYYDDVGILSQDTFSNDGTYAMDSYYILSTTKNYGQNTQAVYDVSLEIKKQGPPVTQTIFSDDMESGLNGWAVEDLDGPISSDIWKQVTTSSQSPPTSWWCGRSDQYDNLSAQLLISPPFSLKWVDSANLTFYHKYATENNYDYCSVDIFSVGSWATLITYDGNGPSSFQKQTISLDDHVGWDEVRIRFRFTSDNFVVGSGWYIDDVEVAAEVPSETTVYGPVINSTQAILAQDATLQLGWDYTFTETGAYKIYITTLLGSDEFQDNNRSITRIQIATTDWSLIPLDFGWNLISLPVIQENNSLEKVLESIEGDYDAVQNYDSSDPFNLWKEMHISKPVDQIDLLDLDHIKGFWLHITKPGGTILNTTGWELTLPESVPLHPGWNMVCYPSLSNHNRTVGLNNLEFGVDVDCIQWFDAAAKTWHFMGPDDDFVPGRGYWMHSNVEAEWEVPL